MIEEFPHLQTAHCETGTLSGLLRYAGFHFSEPMIFGCGSGLYFAYMPYLKYYSIPLISYRIMPGWITRKFLNRFKIEIVKKKYHSKKEAMYDLDSLLEQNIPAGLITNLFFIPYFPDSYRFHFNNHNMIVYGKDKGLYRVSDPIFEIPQIISYDDLAKARFSAGLINLRGNLYYIKQTSFDYDLKKNISMAIKDTAENILTLMPMNGFRGIRYLSKRIKGWPIKLGEKRSKLYLGNIIRMLEEIGTGGSGFRYMYAAFLQESAAIMEKDLFLETSADMTLAGDTWREFSYHAAIICRTNQPKQYLFNAASDLLYRCSQIEEGTFRKLAKS